MAKPQKLLVIDDQKWWRKNLPKLFNALLDDEDYVATGLTPKKFYSSYATDASFDDVAVCFIDLELTHGSDEKPGDTHGRHVALPFVVKLAPWVATACFSRFLSKPTMVGETSLAGFDAVFPKNAFIKESSGDEDPKKPIDPRPNFDGQKLKQYIRELSLKRAAALQGVSMFELQARLDEKPIRLACDQNTSDAVEEAGEARFEEGLRLLGFRGAVGLDRIAPGFSGLNTTWLKADYTDDDGPVSSNWFLKWGDNIHALQKEIAAHHRIVYRGLFDMRHLNTLAPNVLVWKGLGFIAYEFKGNSLHGVDIANSSGGIGELCGRLQPALERLYGTRTAEPVSPSAVIRHWCHPGVEDHVRNDGTLRVTMCVLHGDLHLRNLLICEDELHIIDFARSAFGPLVADLAKFVCDSFVLVSDTLSTTDSLRWDGVSRSDLQPIIDLFAPHLDAADDIKLFDLMLEGYARCYLTYPDVPSDVKAQLDDLLPR